MSVEGSIPFLIQGTFSGQPPRGQNDLGEIIPIEWRIRHTGIPNNKPVGSFFWGGLTTFQKNSQVGFVQVRLATSFRSYVLLRPAVAGSQQLAQIPMD